MHNQTLRELIILALDCDVICLSETHLKNDEIINIEAQSQHFQLFEYFRLFQTSSENTLKHDTTEFNKIQPVSHMAYSIRHNSARSYL